jgi:sulfate adenylyltransferase
MTTSERHGICVWLTGLSGAGKTTVAEALCRRLTTRGRPITVLDGDVVRLHLSKGLGFSPEDRHVNALRIAFVSSEIVRHQGIVISAAITPYEASRREARALVGARHFVLVFVDTPIEECERRDPKGLYAKARRGEIAGFTGVDAPYERPVSPDVVLTMQDGDAEACAARIEQHLIERGLLAP